MAEPGLGRGQIMPTTLLLATPDFQTFHHPERRLFSGILNYSRHCLTNDESMKKPIFCCSFSITAKYQETCVHYKKYIARFSILFRWGSMEICWKVLKNVPRKNHARFLYWMLFNLSLTLFLYTINRLLHKCCDTWRMNMVALTQSF